MNNKILKWGFRYLIIIIILGTIVISPIFVIEKELQQEEQIQDEVPLQEAVEEKKEETKKQTKKTTNKNTNKTTQKKKTTKKVKAKTYVKSKTKKASLNVSGSKAEMKQYVHQLVLSYGWSEYDWQCLVKIINHESGWNPNAVNKSSGACGLFQSLPCSKMKSAGADYRTNYKTQVKWGLGYIKGRYGTPAKAWNFWQKHHWY